MAKFDTEPTLINWIYLQKDAVIRLRNLPIQMKLNYLALLIAMVGMLFCVVRQPELEAPIWEVSWWAGADMLFTVIALTSFIGAAAAKRRIRSIHLKVIDLVWVCASAIGVVFAIIQAFVAYSDESRARFERQLTENRSEAIQLLSVAAREECGANSTGQAKGCMRLAVLNTALVSHGIVDDSLLKEACPPFPIDLSKDLPGYSRSRVFGCIKAHYSVYVRQLPVMLDKENADEWRHQTRIWPLLLMFFIALRVSKSAVEVIWRDQIP